MIIDRKELKANAKKQIKGSVWTFFGLAIVIGILSSLSCCVVIGPLLLTGAFYIGISKFFIDMTKGNKGNFNTGFSGFKQFGSGFVATLLMLIFEALWSCLFVIPGIIAALRYSMTYFILADNPTMSGPDAIKASKKMMVGHKGELFVLYLSFFGWYILSAITFGLVGIYVTPYVLATVTNFYEKIKTESPVEKTAIEA